MSTSVERFNIAPDFSVSRLIYGAWQWSAGHSPDTPEDPLLSMHTSAQAGITTFDGADIYTGVEHILGRFLNEYEKRTGSREDIQILTKFVPDEDALPTITKKYVERIIDRSLRRLGLDQLPMVQFSWWNYDIPHYVDTAYWLKELQQAGKIKLISGTNFNTQAVQNLLAAGIHLSTLQVQYSLLDRRPAHTLSELCARHGIHFLCYGTLAGGFLSEQWLGEGEPIAPLKNRSLIKYKLIIDACGGWEAFQALLTSLKRIADKHHVSIANVATKYVLLKPQVAAAIVGAKHARHLENNLRTFTFHLDHEDLSGLSAQLNQLTDLPGDVFDLERVKESPHGSIMRYNLNQLASD